MISQKSLFEFFDQDLRRRLLRYLEGRISYRKLEISPSYLYMLRKGERNISDNVLAKLLQEISVYEFVFKFLEEVEVGPVGFEPTIFAARGRRPRPS